jgi:hypothetical protein
MKLNNTKISTEKNTGKMSLNEILEGVTRDQFHELIDWGADVGNEMLPADEWGDDGKWETIIDFNKVKKGGVSAGELLKCFKK